MSPAKCAACRIFVFFLNNPCILVLGWVNMNTSEKSVALLKIHLYLWILNFCCLLCAFSSVPTMVSLSEYDIMRRKFSIILICCIVTTHNLYTSAIPWNAKCWSKWWHLYSYCWCSGQTTAFPHCSQSLVSFYCWYYC